MLTQDMNFVAEALIAMCEKDAEAPFFDDFTLERKLREAHQREPVWALLTLRAPGDPLMETECQGVMQEANLTDRQAETFRRRLAGEPFELIGRRRGSTKQAAQQLFLQALKKISRAHHVYPYTGLADVYRFETSRGR